MLAFLGHFLALAHQTPHPIRNLTPQTGAQRRVRRITDAQPVQQVRPARGIKQKPSDPGQHDTSENADQFTGGRMREGGRVPPDQTTQNLARDKGDEAPEHAQVVTLWAVSR